MAALRAMADEQGVAVNRRSADMSATAFDALTAAVAAAGGDAGQITACCRHYVWQGDQGGEPAPPGAGAADAAPAAIADGGGNARALDHDPAGPAVVVAAEPAAAPAPLAADASALALGAFRPRCSSALFTSSLDENERRFLETLAACEERINSNYAVVDLCRSLPARRRELVCFQGGRFRHSSRECRSRSEGSRHGRGKGERESIEANKATPLEAIITAEEGEKTRGGRQTRTVMGWG